MPMLVEELHEARSRWWLFLALGVLLIVLGVLAISSMAFFTELVVIYFGFLLLIGGVSHIVSAFSTRVGGGFFSHLMLGLLDAVVGLLCISRPTVAAGVLTALLAVLFLVGGLSRASLAVALRPPQWGLAVFGGVIEAVLGVIILIDWDENRVWVIGLLVGIELLSRGFSWVVMSLALRRLDQVLPGGN